MDSINKVRFTSSDESEIGKVENAHLSFREIGGGLFVCNKDRFGGFHKGLYTGEDVKAHFNSDNKVVIQTRVEMNKFGGYILSSIANFD